MIMMLTLSISSAWAVYAHVVGGSGDDLLYGDLCDDRMAGGPGDDEMYGGKGYDWMEGGIGNDKLFGQEGDDTIFGGLGNDELTGGWGNDRLEGGYGRDTYFYADGDGFDSIFERGTVIKNNKHDKIVLYDLSLDDAYFYRPEKGQFVLDTQYPHCKWLLLRGEYLGGIALCKSGAKDGNVEFLQDKNGNVIKLKDVEWTDVLLPEFFGRLPRIKD